MPPPPAEDQQNQQAAAPEQNLSANKNTPSTDLASFYPQKTAEPAKQDVKAKQKQDKNPVVPAKSARQNAPKANGNPQSAVSLFIRGLN